MAMLDEDPSREAREARENLRVIRELMERSTKYSTFSGFSGVFAGLASIAGCLVTRRMLAERMSADEFRSLFLLTWSLVVVFAVGADYLLTKRRAAHVGKHVRSSLGRQMLIASAPGLVTGALLTLVFLQQGLLNYVYPVWMLSYGIAVSAVGLFSQREVAHLGYAFLIAGAATLLAPSLGLSMMALTFGGFHILYGIMITRKDGW